VATWKKIATQTELDLKANIASPTFTGTVGLPNYANLETTLDGIEENATAITGNEDDIATNVTAIATKMNLTGGTVTGDVTLDISGNIYIDADGGEARLTDDSNPGNTFVPLDNADITTKKYVDEARPWHAVMGGYKLNNNSSSNYYFQYRPDNSSWSNMDSSPSSITSTDVTAACFIAPEACSVTQIAVQGYCTDTGYSDPFKFYIKKATPVNGYSFFATTDVGDTGTITPGGSGRIYKTSATFSGAATNLAAGDCLFIMLKKDSTTANQDNYFHITLSGKYSL